VLGVNQDTQREKGAAVNNKYQKLMSNAPDAQGFAVPEHVTVAMAQVAGSMREGLLTLAVGAGLQVMSAMTAPDVTRLAGVKGKHAAPPELSQAPAMMTSSA